MWENIGLKISGPDCFNFKFIKTFWATLKEDIMRFRREFFARGVFPRGSNPSSIVLIPKMEDPMNLGEF